MDSLLDVVPGSVDLLLDAWPAQEELQARWPAALRVRLSAGAPQTQTTRQRDGRREKRRVRHLEVNERMRLPCPNLTSAIYVPRGQKCVTRSESVEDTF